VDGKDCIVISIKILKIVPCEIGQENEQEIDEALVV